MSWLVCPVPGLLQFTSFQKLQDALTPGPPDCRGGSQEPWEAGERLTGLGGKDCPLSGNL